MVVRAILRFVRLISSVSQKEAKVKIFITIIELFESFYLELLQKLLIQPRALCAKEERLMNSSLDLRLARLRSQICLARFLTSVKYRKCHFIGSCLMTMNDARGDHFYKSPLPSGATVAARIAIFHGRCFMVRITERTYKRSMFLI